MFKMITTAYDGVTALLLSLPLVRTSNPVRDNATRGRGRTRDTINTMTKIKRERDHVASVLHLLHHKQEKIYIINSLTIIVSNLI